MSELNYLQIIAGRKAKISSELRTREECLCTLDAIVLGYDITPVAEYAHNGVFGPGSSSNRVGSSSITRISIDHETIKTLVYLFSPGGLRPGDSIQAQVLLGITTDSLGYVTRDPDATAGYKPRAMQAEEQAYGRLKITTDKGTFTV